MISFDDDLNQRLAALREQGLQRELRRVDSAPGPRIEIGGKHVGNAPVHVKVVTGQHVDATLTAPGHLGMEVSLGPEDAPRKTIKLKPMAEPAVAVKKPVGPRPVVPRPEGAPRPKSALEERL